MLYNYPMKKAIRISAIVLGGLLLILLILPYFFKDQIKELVLKEVNSALNARVEIADVSLSFLQHFPRASVGIEGVNVIGVDIFERDTLLAADEINLAVDMASVLFDATLEIEAFMLRDAKIKALVLEDSSANWDIVKTDSLAVENETKEEIKEGAFSLVLKGYELRNVDLVFEDAPFATHVDIKGLTHTGKGDFTESIYDLRTQTRATEMTAIYEGIPYLNQTQVEADVNARITNSDTMFIELEKNRFQLNEFELGMAGGLDMWEEDMRFNLSFKSAKSDFRSLLSLVPAVYKEDFAGADIKGGIVFDGFLKGILSETQYPSFGLNMRVNSGSIQYPDLPQNIKEITMDL